MFDRAASPPPPRVARHPVQHSSLTSPRASPPHPFPLPPPRLQERVLPDPAAAPVLFPAASPRADDADAPSAAVASSPGRADAAALARGDEIFSPPCAATFPVLRDVFDAFTDPAASGVHDWSTCDWMAAKVLGPYVAAHPRARDAARALLAWPASLDAPPWLRRVGLVAFVNLVDGEGDDGFDDDDAATTPRGGDALFGEGFVLELARACGAALGVGAIVSEKREEEERMGEVAAGEKEARAKRSVVRRDGGSDAWTAPGAVLDAAGPGERSDPTSDPEAWVRIGARWMLSLCAAECERVAKAETARTGRGRGGVGEDDENEKDAADEKDADAEAGAAPSPAKKPRSKRRRTARA